jgi:asparagine synthase (glutamine-hydrolysing)
MRVDKMTMGVGLEGRVPFLDHRLVALAMSIPSDRKVANGTLKHLLKTAVRGLIPDELIDRRKQGFGVPVDELFQGRLAVLATAELDRFCAHTDLIDRAAVDDLMRRGEGSKIWYLLNLAMWWREYIARDAPAAAA